MGGFSENLAEVGDWFFKRTVRERKQKIFRRELDFLIFVFSLLAITVSDTDFRK